MKDLTKELRTEINNYFGMIDKNSETYNKLKNDKRLNEKYLFDEKTRLDNVNWQIKNDFIKKNLNDFLEKHSERIKNSSDNNKINSTDYQLKLSNAIKMLELGADPKTLPFLKEVENVKDVATITVLNDKFETHLADHISENIDKSSKLVDSMKNMVDMNFQNNNDPFYSREVMHITLNAIEGE